MTGLFGGAGRWRAGAGVHWTTSCNALSWPFWRPWRTGTRRRGSFLTWYGYHLQGAFTEAAGQRTKRERQDPLQWAVSLDAPLVDSEGDALLLEDVVEDPASEGEFLVVEELDRREAIRRALSHLTADQRTAVVLRHCRGLTLDLTAERMGTTRALARTAEQKGLRRLRHPSISRELRQYV